MGADHSILASLFETRGEPKYLRSDNGPEFVAHSLTVWLAMSGTESRFIKPGSPWQNGIVESFNGKLRAEFLNAEVFHNLAEAQMKLRLFQRFYNEERPHSSLGYLTPATYKRISQESINKEELYS
jgi:putative transposase